MTRNTLDIGYAQKLGVESVGLADLPAAGYGRTGAEIADALVRSGSIDMIVIDSVAARRTEG